MDFRQYRSLRESRLSVIHTHFCGTMHNKSSSIRPARCTTWIPVLRFNFRGAGLSQGMHDKGTGEANDVRAALDYLAAEFPLGQSFLRDSALARGWDCAWAANTPGKRNHRSGNPGKCLRLSYLESFRKPKLFLQGGDDTVRFHRARPIAGGEDAAS